MPLYKVHGRSVHWCLKSQGCGLLCLLSMCIGRNLPLPMLTIDSLITCDSVGWLQQLLNIQELLGQSSGSAMFCIDLIGTARNGAEKAGF